MNSPQDLELANELTSVGFDIVQPFETNWYNEILDDEGLTDLLRLESNCRAYLIGNTKNLWNMFLKWCQDKEGTIPEHPVNTYTEEKVSEIAKRYFTSPELHWSHNIMSNKLISMQRISVLTGLTFQDNSTHLSVNPVYGSWLAFRAVLVVLGETGSRARFDKPKRLENFLTAEQQEVAVTAWDRAMKLATPESLVIESLHCKEPASDAERIQAWIALRYVVDRPEWEYTKNQVWYHYSKDFKYVQADLDLLERG